MVEYKPKSRTTLLDRLKTALPFCESVVSVNMLDPATEQRYFRAKCWEKGHGIIHEEDLKREGSLAGL